MESLAAAAVDSQRCHFLQAHEQHFSLQKMAEQMLPQTTWHHLLPSTFPQPVSSFLSSLQPKLRNFQPMCILMWIELVI